jgi:hypothetical protein
MPRASGIAPAAALAAYAEHGTYERAAAALGVSMTVVWRGVARARADEERAGAVVEPDGAAWSAPVWSPAATRRLDVACRHASTARAALARGDAALAARALDALAGTLRTWAALPAEPSS